MAISVTCQCGQEFHVGEELAGRSARCRTCGHVLVIPDAPTPAAPDAAQTVQCQCGKRFRAAEWLAGRQVPCPACGATIAIPAPGSSPAEGAQHGASPSADPLWDEAFSGPLPSETGTSRPLQPRRPPEQPSRKTERARDLLSTRISGRQLAGLGLILWGLLMAVWVGYNVFIERLPQFPVHRVVPAILFTLLLLAGGVQLLRRKPP